MLLRGQFYLNAHVSPKEELATTAISIAELAHGAHRSLYSKDNLARLGVLLSVLVILLFDEAAGRKFGALKVELEARGGPLENLDLQIASIALENQCQLLTDNSRHFSRIDDLPLLNWLG
jgi:tRNA(fMet)-specific endonuclease VapC